MKNEIEELIENFIVDVTAAAEQNISTNVLQKLQGNLAFGKLGVKAKKLAPGKYAVAMPKTARRKGPIQLCPSPGCKERAAPVFGMLCGKHKGTSKKVVAKWREARRIKAIKQGKKPVGKKPSKPVAKKPAKPATKKS